jgi:hypothetical protein
MSFIKSRDEKDYENKMVALLVELEHVYGNKSSDEYKMCGDITKSKVYGAIENMIANLSTLKGINKNDVSNLKSMFNALHRPIYKKMVTEYLNGPNDRNSLFTCIFTCGYRVLVGELSRIFASTVATDKGLIYKPDKISKSESAARFIVAFNKDMDKKVDEYIKVGREYRPILNSLNKLYKDQKKVEKINTSQYCPFEYYSDPEDQYKLTLDETKLLLKINDFETSLLQGIKIGDLYKTTKIVLCDAPNESDLLGSYSHEEKRPLSKRYYPVVRIYMDRVEAVAKELGRERKYIIASVYIHEMIHRYYDIRPDLGWKKSVKEIEEPMAVFGAMKFCEEFDKELLKMSRRLTADLLKSEWYDLYHYYVYILGLEMFNRGVGAGLINTYRYVSLMMHKSRSEVEGFVNPIDSYVDL